MTWGVRASCDNDGRRLEPRCRALTNVPVHITRKTRPSAVAADRRKGVYRYVSLDVPWAMISRGIRTRRLRLIRPERGRPA